MPDAEKPVVKTAAPMVESAEGISDMGKERNSTNRRRLLLITIVLALIAVASASAWALFFRPINVEVSWTEQDVAVQGFGLGTVEARVASKVGFKVAGVLVELHADVGDCVAVRARIVMDILRRMAVEQSAAIIVVTHDEMILDGFDHTFRLRDGRLETEPAVGFHVETATVS